MDVRMPAAAGANTIMKPVSKTASTPIAMTVSMREKPLVVMGRLDFMT
jgi:hypothetical protein